VHLTDWRGDADECLDDTGRTLGDVLSALARRGVQVRGLVWRSHPDEARLSEQEAVHLAEVVNEAGGEILLDERVRRFGSHHQKLVLVRYRRDEDDDVAFVGGIDLCHGRNDDARHLGDPQAFPLDERYGDRPPWHDVQLEVRGPAVGDLAWTFRERWEDPTPLDHRNPFRARIARLVREPRRPDPLPPMPEDPAPAGPHVVQVLRTYPSKRPRYPFAPDGERSVARAYTKALRRARRLVYLEDQYLWSGLVADALAEALAEHRDLHVIAVVPRFPEEDGPVSGPPLHHGRCEAVSRLVAAGGDRFAIYDIQNDVGTPVYVHAKVCVIDDVWAATGSDNLNRRSWTHDSELGCAVLDRTLDVRAPTDPAGLGDGARVFARSLRLQLWAEHLRRSVDDPALLDPAEGFELWRETAAAGTGRVRRHESPAVRAWHRPWAAALYRTAVDPDGRPRSLRGTDRF
jgi:phosphatidylserine/phosphatidylglycerophosphate/cardiolipin synthase-like enzyme